MIRITFSYSKIQVGGIAYTTYINPVFTFINKLQKITNKLGVSYSVITTANPLPTLLSDGSTLFREVTSI